MATLLAARHGLRALALAATKPTTRRLHSSFSKHRRSSRIGQTSVFVQSGLKIRELPLVVKKVNDVLQISGMDAFKSHPVPAPVLESYEEFDNETAELVAGFSRCFSVNGIFKLLESIPLAEVTPPVAVYALNKVLDLENSAVNSRKELSMAAPPSPANADFLRMAFINQLLDIVYRCRDPKIILEGLRVVSRDTFPGDQAAAYKERMSEEVGSCVKGEFSEC